MARLLLLDDDPDQLEMRKLVMEENAHAVATAHNTRSGLRAFDETIPEVVIMDLRLPRTEDGLELIRGIRERGVPVCIIVLSGWLPDLRSKPEAALVDHALQKPIRTRNLFKLIDNAV